MKLNHLNKIAIAAYFNFVFLPSVHAGILSANLCKPYKLIVDNELFVVIALIVASILCIAWKLMPSGTVLQRAVGLLAALSIALNLENLLQTFGYSIVC